MKTFLLAFLLSTTCYGSPCGHIKKVAIIDTGFGYKDKGHHAKLCKYGHKDFSNERKFSKDYGTAVPLPLDTNGHGTNVEGVIEDYAKGANYCVVILKYYSAFQTGRQNLEAETQAIKYATDIKVDYINFSGGGPEFIEDEYWAVERFLDNKGKFIAAAGNEHQNLSENPYYPAVYDKRIVVVENIADNGIRSPTSNYGTAVTRKERGENVTAYGLTMSGTSQATAIATGKILAETANKCDIGF